MKKTNLSSFFFPLEDGIYKIITIYFKTWTTIQCYFTCLVLLVNLHHVSPPSCSHRFLSYFPLSLFYVCIIFFQVGFIISKCFVSQHLEILSELLEPQSHSHFICDIFISCYRCFDLNQENYNVYCVCIVRQSTQSIFPLLKYHNFIVIACNIEFHAAHQILLVS